MIKDDQGGTRNPYRCMNVMKQDAMDDKGKMQNTHTLNKSNQFYISKISQDSLVSIH